MGFTDDRLTPVRLSHDAIGIQQSDVIMRQAIRAGLADIQANPYLLNYCFSTLVKDGLTNEAYGQKEVLNAKAWFLQNSGSIRVVMATQMNAGDKLPCISIELAESAEAQGENTLGDINYQYLEPVDKPWPNLCDPFTPTSWDASTDTLTLPAATVAQLDLSPGMVLVTAAGQEFPILETPDGATAILSGAGTNVNFKGSVIRGSHPAVVRHMESASFRESYSIGLHVHGEPVYLTYLHSIIVFLLLRYREVLLEGRGYERTTISSSEMARNAFFAQENVFTRYISISGFVRQYWPKLIVPRITSVQGAQAATSLLDGSVNTDTLEDPSQYGVRGPDQSPYPPDVEPNPGGVQGPAVAPTPNGQMDSALQDEAPEGTAFGVFGPIDPATI